MENIIRGLVFALIPIIVNGVFAFLRQPKNIEKGKVYLPKFFAILGVITSTIFLIPAFITVFSDEPIWVPIVFFFFSSLGAILIIAFVNCRISYDEDGFIAKSFFGIKRKYTYDQVTAIKENMHEKYICIDKRKVMVDEFSIGGNDFIKLVKKKYRTLHNGQSLPKVYTTKYDIFNGNISDVTGFLFAFIMVAVIAIGFLIFTVCYTYIPSTLNNTNEQSVSFISYDVENEDIILTSSDNEIFKIHYADKQTNIEGIKSICNGKTSVTTYSKEFTDDDETPYHSVKAIIHNDIYILSFEETNKLHIQEYRILVLFGIFMCLVWGAYVVATIIVGRNPKKFSKKIIRLFFKDGYIKY